MWKARLALPGLGVLPVSPDWPRFGIDLTAGWSPRGWPDGIAHTRLRDAWRENEHV